MTVGKAIKSLFGNPPMMIRQDKPGTMSLPCPIQSPWRQESFWFHLSTLTMDPISSFDFLIKFYRPKQNDANFANLADDDERSLRAVKKIL